MNHLPQIRDLSISNQQNAFVTHLPKAVAMLLLGTSPRPTEPKFTLMDGTLSSVEGHGVGVSIMVIEL